MTTEHYDDLETRSHDEREAALFAALTTQLTHARTHSAAYAELLADIDPTAITDRAALATVPTASAPARSTRTWFSACSTTTQFRGLP